MDKITLVIGNRNYSSWSLRAWLAMTQAGIPFVEVLIPLWEGDWDSEIARRSPSCRVPVLEEGGRTVWETLAIIEYLHERFPDRGLWPANAEARAVARAVSAEMHAGFAALRAHMPMNLRKSLPGRGRGPGVADDIARIEAIWGDCRHRFGDGGPFLFGAFSAADAMYAPVATRFATYGVELDAACGAYRDTVMALPALGAWSEAARAEPWVIAENEVD
ncbi:MAG TPA: glutathione S-transferase family protein [Rhodospirillales bacterium]|nr:glutathione S-transferase family protein [Rhodospirillales bacterium]